MPEDSTQNNPQNPANPSEGETYPENIADIAHELYFLADDRLYQKLIASYQHGEWDDCKTIITQLLEKYPGTPGLVQFEQDIDMRLLMRDQGYAGVRKTRKKSLWKAGRLIIFGILSAILVVAAAFLLIRSQAINEARLLQEKQQAAQQTVMDLEKQAQTLLQAGKLDAGLEVIGQIEGIDPGYAGLEALKSLAGKVAQLDAMYAEAVRYQNENEFENALALFKDIEEVDPKYRDVQYQIKQIETVQQVESLVSAMKAAYTAEDWGKVISSYEAIMLLNPGFSDPDLEEMIFRGYYFSIVKILNNRDASLADIENAEDYYVKAVSLIPQNKAFAEERKDLQEFIVGLLVNKYTATAKSLIEMKDCSTDTAARAVNYLKKAVNLEPDNAKHQTDLEKARIYQLALENFVKLDWDPAIQGFEKLTSFEKNYAGGMALKFLYEAHTYRGSRYYSVGFYQDARADFNAAEIIAWDFKDNKMRIFEAQMNMGNVLGKTQNYKEACEYFDYALGGINAYTNASDPDFMVNLTNARNLFAIGDYFNAYLTYLDAFEKLDTLYDVTELDIESGQNLVCIAETRDSTVQSISKLNGISGTIVLKSDRTLAIPSIR